MSVAEEVELVSAAGSVLVAFDEVVLSPAPVVLVAVPVSDDEFVLVPEFVVLDVFED